MTDEELDRRTSLFVFVYQSVRREKGQRWYTAFQEDLNKLPKESPLFKQFRTVTQWLCTDTWCVQLSDCRWKGYVEYVFDQCAPGTPQPGQIKNIVLFKKYMMSFHVQKQDEVVTRSSIELANLYRKVLHPDFSSFTMMKVLGLPTE